MRLICQMLTFELDNQKELVSVINKYEAEGWKMIDRGVFIRNPKTDKLEVTVEFKKN